jgi:hypothetical protein
MNQRHRFKTEKDYQKWLKERFVKGGKITNKKKGFGSNKDLASKYGKLTKRRSNGRQQ